MLLKIFLLLGCSAVLASAVDYCTIKSCSQHTMCTYPNSGPGPKCKGYEKGSLTQEEKEIIVKEHNLLRNKVATGKQDKFPMAANMAQVEWDNELAEIAQRHADQCEFQHDSCRNVERFYVGQNIASIGTTAKTIDVKKYLKQMVNNWYNEVKFAPVSEVDNFTSKGNGGVIGHFTQVIWATSSKMGCGFTQTYDGVKWRKATLMCNYGPGGNMLRSKIYIKGKSCSKCSKCSSEYPGLCNS